MLCTTTVSPSRDEKPRAWPQLGNAGVSLPRGFVGEQLARPRIASSCRIRILIVTADPDITGCVVPARCLHGPVGLTLVFWFPLRPKPLNLSKAEIYDLGKQCVKEWWKSGLYSDGRGAAFALTSS